MKLRPLFGRLGRELQATPLVWLTLVLSLWISVWSERAHIFGWSHMNANWDEIGKSELWGYLYPFFGEDENFFIVNMVVIMVLIFGIGGIVTYFLEKKFWGSITRGNNLRYGMVFAVTFSIIWVLVNFRINFPKNINNKNDRFKISCRTLLFSFSTIIALIFAINYIGGQYTKKLGDNTEVFIKIDSIIWFVIMLCLITMAFGLAVRSFRRELFELQLDGERVPVASDAASDLIGQGVASVFKIILMAYVFLRPLHKAPF